MNTDVENESVTTELIQTNLMVTVTHNSKDSDAFNENRQIPMHPNFLNLKDAKRHNITSHSRWFKNKIKLNHLSEEIESINKWKICIVDFGMNIETEINGIRPVIVYKHDNYKFGEDIVVIPITSYDDEKSIDIFDIKLEVNDCDILHHISLIKIRQIKSISKKRLRKDK